jgi:hypothetical protein
LPTLRLYGPGCEVSSIVGHADLVIAIADAEPCDLAGPDAVSVARIDFDGDADDDFIVRLQCAQSELLSEFYLFQTTATDRRLVGTFKGYSLRRGAPGHLILVRTSPRLPCAVVWTGTAYALGECGPETPLEPDLFFSVDPGRSGYRPIEAGDFIIQGQPVWTPDPNPLSVTPRPLRLPRP